MKFAILKDPTNFFEALQPSYFTFKFFGLFPFSFDGPIKHGKIQFTCFDLLWSVFVWIIDLSILALSFRDLNNPPDSWNSNVLKIGFKVILMVGLFGSFVISVNLLRNREKIKEFLDILARFDEQVRDFSYFMSC